MAKGCGVSRETAEAVLKDEGCLVGYREVDGCAGEFPSGSGYYYGVYGAGSDKWDGQRAV